MHGRHPLFEPVPPADDGVGAANAPAAAAPSPLKLAALYGTDAPAALPARRVPGRVIAGAAAVLAGVALCVAVVLADPGLFAAPAGLKAAFTAPLLVLRATGPTEVTSVAVRTGQRVEPSTVLLTLRGSADANGSPAAEQPVRAGIGGQVSALDAKPGAHLLGGAPLAQLADCGRAFLLPQDPGQTLAPGQTVVIRMQGMAPFRGAVRRSAGVAEPADTLVIDPTGLAAVAPNACPVGAGADIRPD